MYYRMVIKPNNPDRYTPYSWKFQQAPGKTIWATALDIADREDVTLLRVVDEKRRNVPLER